jgi:two-component system, OmpR family, sensor kinase
VHTPSLRRRVVASGVGVVALVLAVVAVVVVATVDNRLDQSLEGVLDARAALAVELDTTHPTHEVAERLQELGVPAIVRTVDGEVLLADPAGPALQTILPGPNGPDAGPWLRREVTLDDGATVEVLASRAGVDSTMRGLAVSLALATTLALALAVLLLRRVTRRALSPLDAIAVAAGRTAAGRTGQRLEPDDPTTELGRVARAHDRMVSSLEDALAEAQQAEERTRRFVDDAAHQLRTPFATIRGSVEAMLGEPDPRVRDRLLANVVREVARSDRLLSSLLTLARIDQGRPVELAPTDVEALCRDEVGRMASLAPQLSITTSVRSQVRGAWQLDDAALREILANLLDNAGRHADGTIEVVVDTDGADDDREVAYLQVRVHDDGPGLDPDEVELAFERFASLDGQGGSGLGLPIARDLARSQGGDVTCDDGAFVVRLPAVRA